MGLCLCHSSPGQAAHFKFVVHQLPLIKLVFKMVWITSQSKLITCCSIKLQK